MRPRWLLSYHYLRKWDLDEFFAPYDEWAGLAAAHMYAL